MTPDPVSPLVSPLAWAGVIRRQFAAGYGGGAVEAASGRGAALRCAGANAKRQAPAKVVGVGGVMSQWVNGRGASGAGGRDPAAVCRRLWGLALRMRGGASLCPGVVVRGRVVGALGCV